MVIRIIIGKVEQVIKITAEEERLLKAAIAAVREHWPEFSEEENAEIYLQQLLGAAMQKAEEIEYYLKSEDFRSVKEQMPTLNKFVSMLNVTTNTMIEENKREMTLLKQLAGFAKSLAVLQKRIGQNI